MAVGCCLFLAALPAGADSPPAAQPSIVASQYHYDEASKTLRAEGNVEAAFQGMTLHCPALLFNLAQESLQVEGEMQLAGPQFSLKGRELTYDLRRRSGALTDVSGVVGSISGKGAAAQWPLVLTAPRVAMDAGSLTVSDARFTFCDAPKPHFWLAARKLSLIPGQSANLTGGSLWLYGHKLFTYPRYALSLKGKGQLPFPTVGVNKGWGAFAGLSAPLFTGQGQVALSSKGGIVGKWVASGQLRKGAPPERRGGWEVAFARRQDAKDPLNSALLLDVYPSATLTHPLGNLGQVTATYARMRELPTQNRGREAGLRWIGAEEQVGKGKTTLTLRPQAWHNEYDKGVKCSGFTLEMEAKRKIGKGESLSLAYVHNGVSGASPFQFERDAVFLTDELRPRAELRLGEKWGLGLLGRYDMEKGRFEDKGVKLDAIQHCLTYSLEWAQARRQFDLSVGLSQRD